MAEYVPATATSRRATYGLNVTVAVLATLALVVLVNWIGHTWFYQRFDFTATRQYSLSDQTYRVLDRLEGDYRIVTLLGVPDRAPRRADLVRRVRDLADEYARRSGRITAEHLDPGLDITRVEQFYRDLESRFEAELAPAREALETGAEQARELRQGLGAIAERAREANASAAANAPGEAGAAADFLQRLEQSLAALFLPELDAALEKIESGNRSPRLPDYRGRARTLRRLLGEIDEQLLAVAARRLEQLARERDLSGNLQESLLALAEQCRVVRKPLAAARRPLGDLSIPEGWQNLRRALDRTRDALLVLGPKRVRVVPASALYQQVQAEGGGRRGEEGAPEIRFLGEEKLTGALLGLSLKNPPLIVFVNPGRAPATGPRGIYSRVAERLETAGLEVESWSPGGGRQGPMGQRQAPAPPPNPEPGQRTVWILLPGEPPSPRNPMGSGPAMQQAAEHVKARLEVGDHAMLLLAPSPGGMMPGADSAGPLLADWGIEARTDRILMRSVPGPRGEERAIPLLEIDTWLETHPIVRALGGMRGAYLGMVPLVLGEQEGVELVPLLRITSERVWAETEFGDAPPEFDPEKANAPYIAGAAAERAEDATRLAVFGGARWAGDEVTGYGTLGPGTADLTGSKYPANAELFLNSVYWLAGLDTLIAASARAQDLRRIGPVSPGAMSRVRWLLGLGLPGAVFVCGLTVWWVRRRE